MIPIHSRPHLFIIESMRVAPRKTVAQQLVEERYGKRLELLLPELVERHGKITAISEAFSDDGLYISYSTVARWLRQYQVPTEAMLARDRAYERRKSAA